jgi:hypothetical protein
MKALTSSILENCEIGTAVGNPVKGADPDGDALSYSIISGNGEGIFAINNITGQITTAKKAVDFEVRSKYVLSVQAMDSGEGNLTAASLFTVFVTDQNEPPIIEDMLASITENVRIGTKVGIAKKVRAVDLDHGQSNTLTFKFFVGSTTQTYTKDEKFDMDTKSGEIYVRVN